MASLLQVECPKCHTKNKPGSRFCGECGEALPGSEVKCGNCGAMVPADKRFCGQCGKPLAESTAPLLTGNRWARRVEDFATKVEVDDVEGFFKKGLIVEGGTKAIFFVNGACSGILEPGRYDMGGLLQKIKNVFSSKSTTAVLVDSGDIELRFSLAELRTRDPIKLAAECRLVVQMENPTQFFENLMKGRQNYPLSELKAFLEGELHNCLQEFVGTRSVQELSSDLAFKQQMDREVAQHLAVTFDRKGLSFVQVRVLDFRHPHLDSLTNTMEEYWLHAQDLETRLAGGTLAAGVERKLLDQETAKELMKVEVYEDRAKVYERMRQAVASAEMNKVTSAEEMEKFLQNIDKNKLLRKDEIETLVRDFAERKEDHDVARRHLILKLKKEQEIEMAQVEVMGKIGLRKAVSEAEREEKRADVDFQLASRRKVIEQRYAEEVAAAQAQADARRIQAQSDLDIAEKGVGIYEKMKEAQQKEKDREEARQTRVEDRRDEREIARIRELAALSGGQISSTELFVVGGPAAGADRLADLKRTEALKGLSPDQILAMDAAKSPEAAKALQEKFREAAAREERDRVSAVKDQAAAELREVHRAHEQKLQDMYDHGLDTQRDTAVAAARGGQPGVVAATPGMAPPGAGQAPPAGGPGTVRRVVVCPKCHKETEEGNKFCENCAYQFYS